MRILVTNDDGIHAFGLAALERIAATLSARMEVGFGNSAAVRPSERWDLLDKTSAAVGGGAVTAGLLTRLDSIGLPMMEVTKVTMAEMSATMIGVSIFFSGLFASLGLGTGASPRGLVGSFVAGEG